MSDEHTSAPTPQITPSALLTRGFALFPLRPGAKVPAVARDWEHVATTSPARLRQLSLDPQANYGVACGPSNLLVVDLDVAKDEAPGSPRDGWQVLRELATERGEALPHTFTVSTPSGGRHLYFRPSADAPAPRNTVRRLGPLIDTRGVGGYVVAPGSRVDGVEYRVIVDAPIVELPEWISTLLRTPAAREARPAPGEPLSLAAALGPLRTQLSGAYARTALEREAARVESARVGTRNDTLNRAAYNLGTLIGARLLDQAQAEAELTRAARAAGLDERETASTLRSGMTAGIARPRQLIGASAAAAGVRQLSLLGDSGAEDEAEAEAIYGQGDGSGDRSNVAVLAPGRALIPTFEPRISDWPHIFGGFVQLGVAAMAVRRELAATDAGFDLATTQPTHLPADSQGPDTADVARALVELLTELDSAYDAAAHSSGSIAGSARWQGIISLVDVLRDLHDELAQTSGDLPEPPFALVTSLTSAAARQIVELAKEITVKLGSADLRRSPLWIALRRLQRAAEALAAFGAAGASDAAGASAEGQISSGRFPRYSAGRGALQAQLATMRRDFQSAGSRSHPATAAG